jgi:cytoskeleton protein RodZ
MSDALNPTPGIETGSEVAYIVVQSVGEQLIAARKARRLEVVDVAQALKLGSRQVEALENGDWEVLPGQTFIRGFVRNYARLVQIDSAPLMMQLDSVLHKPVDTLNMSQAKPASMSSGTTFGAPRHDRMVVVFGLLLVVAAALAYFLLDKDLSSLRETAQATIDSLARKNESEAPAEAKLPSDPSAATTPAAPAEPVFPPGTTPQQVMNPQALTPPEPLSPAPVTLSSEVAKPEAEKPVATSAQLRFVVDKESWIEVRDRDSKVVFSERVAPGGERSVNGQGPLSLVVGYAPGVKLYWRGEPIDLVPHARGDVARLVLE